MNWLQIMQLTGNCITILGLILFIILGSKKVFKDLKIKKAEKKARKEHANKEAKIKEDLYKAYLKNETKGDK